MFTVDDLSELTELVAGVWSSGADWSAPAGGYLSTCRPARKNAGADYDWGPFTMGDRATPTNLVDGLRAASRLLAAIVVATPSDVRAAIWRRPAVEARGPADFVPRGAMELALHGHDVALGLGVPFEPPAPLAKRLRDHTSDWPMWSVWGHGGLPITDDPWGDLLACSGRARRA